MSQESNTASWILTESVNLSATWLGISPTFCSEWTVTKLAVVEPAAWHTEVYSIIIALKDPHPFPSFLYYPIIIYYNNIYVYLTWVPVEVVETGIVPALLVPTRIPAGPWMYRSGSMRVLACCCAEEDAVVSGDSDDTFAAFSWGFNGDVSHEEAGICGVAIDDTFILSPKQFLKSHYNISFCLKIMSLTCIWI